MEVNTSNVILKIKCGILSTISVLSLYISGENLEIPHEVIGRVFSNPFVRALLYFKYSIKSYDIIVIPLFICFYFIYKASLKKERDSYKKSWQIVISGFSALIMLLCESYYKVASWDLVFGGKAELLISLVRVFGWGGLVYCALSFVDLSRLTIQNFSEKNRVDKKTEIIKNIGIIFLCWLPYIVLLFPGCFASDVQDEIAQIYNDPSYCWTAKSIVLLDENVILNNHHPVVYTQVLRVVLKLGELIGSYEWAFEVYCIIQCLLITGIFSYALYIMKRENVRKKYINCTLAFFSLNPLFPIYGMTVVKDVVFSALFFLIIIMLYEIIISEKSSLKRLFVLFFVSLAFMLMRNNGFYIFLCLIVGVFILVVVKKQDLKKLLITLITPCIIFQLLINNLIYPMLNISQGSIRELLSIPFQQTARYIAEVPDDISESEELVISTVLCPNSDIQEIADAYNPEVADPVKNGFNKNCTKEDLIQYIEVWGKQLMRHPTIYIQAFLNMNYRWFSYYGNTFTNSTYVTQDGLELGSIVEGFTGAGGFSKVRQTLAEIIRTLEKIPIGAILLKHATYTWIYLALFIYMIIKHKWKCLIVSASVYINYMICFVGPVGYSRYAFPMICCLPFIIFMVFKRDKDVIQEKNERKIVFKG